MEVTIGYNAKILGVAPHLGDDVDASCEAFEVMAHRICQKVAPDCDVTVTADDTLATLDVKVLGAVDELAGSLKVRNAVWGELWDVIGPYGHYRRPIDDTARFALMAAHRRVAP